jgi:hypothetical protein
VPKRERVPLEVPAHPNAVWSVRKLPQIEDHAKWSFLAY